MLVPDTYADRRVCVLGLGYVGLPLAAVMAEAGFDVLGIEIRDPVRERLARGEPHFYEPGLESLLKRVIRQGRLRIARNIPAGCAATVFLVTVGTPLDTLGRARMDMIENVTREVAAHLKAGDLVIMRSTVKLGTTRRLVIPILDSVGVSYDLAFCPERTLEGQALAELRNLPQVVGGATLSANIRASQLFQFLTATVVRVSSLETAEMIKLIDNTQRDVSFAFANEVARMCDAVGIGAMEVIRAGKLGYARTNLPMPGPVGGPCLEKDSYILAEGLAERGVTPEITLAARNVNRRQPEESVAAIKRIFDGIGGCPPAPVIALLGLAFKGRPATDDLRGSMALHIRTALQAVYPQAQFRGWDAVVTTAGTAALGLVPAPSLDAAVAGANLVVIANNHPTFAAMPLTALADTLARPGLIYDFWNNFDARDVVLPPGVGYMALGSHGHAVLPAVALQSAAK